MMKIKIDTEADAAYIYLYGEGEQNNGKLRSEPVDENIILDYTQDGKLFGIEVLSLKVLNLQKIRKEKQSDNNE